MARLAQIFRLVFADLGHEKLLSLCQVVAIAAVLAPLLVLFGLREGVIGTLIERLNRDPAMRLIVPEVTGANRFDAAWFKRIGQRPDVAFVLPSTRAIAGQVDLARADDPGAPVVRVSWLPTASGDPLSPAGRPLADGLAEISLSAAAAERLGAAAGAAVNAAIERQRAGKIEPVRIQLKVGEVVPPELYDGVAAFVSLPLLEAVQAYRDGYAVPALGWEGDGPAPAMDAYPLFRLYARSIQDVPALAADLRAEGVVVSTREGEIASALSLERNLTTVLLVITGLALIGFVVAVAINAVAGVERKRKHLAVLKLVGYGPSWLTGIPLLQAGVLALAGAAVAVAAFSGVAVVVNAAFAGSLQGGEAACRLSAAQLLGAGAATVAIAMVPALFGGLLAARIEPSLELRDV